ncbi:MAG: geranylgeranylglyceryl/heptaprenylglyceryl phosphate synthase [Candidatus Thermoplasmatota archaeon]
MRFWFGRRGPRPRFVEEYLNRHLRHGPLHITLIDPDRQDPKEAAAMAKAAADAGSHAIMVGGSTPEKARIVDKSCKLIKKESGLPVILFPGGASQVSTHADAIWWMSLLNSRSRHFLIGEQVRGAPVVKKLDLETLPMGYIVVEPGGTVGKVGQADLVGREDHATAIAYALTAQYFGMRFVYLEAGSGADRPVPPAMIRAVKGAIDIPLIVGGGLRTAAAAHEAIEAGADIIVTGTLVEGVTDVRKTLGDYLFQLSESLRREVRRTLVEGEPEPPRRPEQPDDEDETKVKP